MPIAPGPGIAPIPPLVPQVVPAGQKVTPVEPARRIVPKKQSGGADLEPEDKRARSDERGGLFDVEV
jgi:hypothetical protein